MVSFISRFIVLLALVLATANKIYAQNDPFDPFDNWSYEFDEDPFGPSPEDDNKSAEQLVREGAILLEDERLLDARTKLLKALKKNPDYYQAHILLSGYYLRYVGHFRLALKYIMRALEIFKKEHGLPPYQDEILRSTHGHILYIFSQARLNLDNYQGALDLLDEFNSYAYYEDWYPGSRAWVLMKLGKLDEAIKVSRLGILQGAELGRTLNMLGILLSMTGEREESLKIFKEAIRYELSLGSLGQPATPLNNSGEVYKEIFFEDKAESSWLKATSLPDGCEHILPSLNLSLLYIDQLNFKQASKALDNFEACFAQYPLRSDEEHRALVNLGRGRIDLHTGKIDSALEHLEAAVDRRQWFGKIGTSEDDLRAASLSSLASALEVKNEILSSKLTDGIFDYISILKDRTINYIRSWWLNRKAKQVLSENLENFEDLYVRHTDSMLEYATLGSLIAEFPANLIENKISIEDKNDPRKDASIYYNAYLAESQLASSNSQSALKLLNDTISQTRPPYDNLLIVHLLALKTKHASLSKAQKNKLVEKIYSIHPPAVRNYGLKLPINFVNISSDIKSDLLKSSFLEDTQSEIQLSWEAGKLKLKSPTQAAVSMSIDAKDQINSLNRFIDTVFVNKS
ncbi:MAG: tetratricopeptide repeat protein [Bdellovibrionales bacterium]|nr:tetratricopeptide repeat protein [Bdellovibrionales bacterium]